MEELINSAFKWYMRRRVRQINNFRNNPIEVQQHLFKGLMDMGKGTEWGQKYAYRELQNEAQFKERVPISTYEKLHPYIERMMKGEQNILWPTKITEFSKSSGTTNARSKFIPVSKEALEGCHYKAGKDMISIYMERYPDTRVMLGKNLAVGGTYQQNELFKDSVYGDVSAIIMKNLPIWAEWRRSPGIEVALMDEWEQKIDRMAEETMQENITSFAGVPTWTLILIQKVLEKAGTDNILDVWPNVELFIHGAVAFGPYRETFKQLIKKENMHYMDVYTASEGFFAIQDTETDNEMLLLLDYGIYYEFVETRDIFDEHPKSVGLDEVEIGKNYAMVISTNAGLWRYMIGDTVRFTSKYPFRIKITGRTKHYINAFGEEVVIENAVHALNKACDNTGARIANFTAAPIYLEAGKKGGHEWVIEFEQEPDDQLKFNEILDDELKSINSDYDAKRYKDIALVAPIVHVAPSGTFYEWMKQRGKLGGQHKVPRLSNTREYIETLLPLLVGQN